jgi:hypothetical protein
MIANGCSATAIITTFNQPHLLNNKMRAHTPNNLDGRGSRRSSVTNRFRASTSTNDQPSTSLRKSRVSQHQNKTKQTFPSFVNRF